MSGLIIVIIIGVVLVFIFLRSRIVEMYNSRYWEDPVVHGLDGAAHLGHPLNVQFRRQAKKPIYLEGASVTAELRCTEWVRYQSGTDTVTKEKIVKRVPANVHVIPDDNAMAAHIGGVIPHDGPASFSFQNNRVSWELHIAIESPKAADPKHDYPILVHPRLGAPRG